MVADLMSTWADGWAVSRECPRPTALPWGHYIEVDAKPHEVGRHVLFGARESQVRDAAASVSVPRTWIKMPAEPAEVGSWLPQGWVEQETGHLMAVDLTATHPVAPEGYTPVVETEGSVIRVRVLDGSGAQAAQGQMAALGEAVVVDRVSTEEAHRRRGLGAFVMRALADRAVLEGASLGVLGATDAGRALYETLGWKKHTSLAEYSYLP